jgi:hypothetical protein
VIVIDEAAHVNPDLFFKVILPILQMKNTALFALSSPEGSQNYFSKLINLKVNGQPFFRICDCQMICEDCRKLDRDKQIQCNHVKQTAHWLSSKKGERLKLLYAADPATAMKELAGIIEDDYLPCFPKDLIAAMFAMPPVVTQSTPNFVFVTVDPSGGGMSQLAICSGYYRETDHVVSGPITYSSLVDSRKFSSISMALNLLYGNFSVMSMKAPTRIKNALKWATSSRLNMPFPSNVASSPFEILVSQWVMNRSANRRALSSVVCSSNSKTREITLVLILFAPYRFLMTSMAVSSSAFASLSG